MGAATHISPRRRVCWRWCRLATTVLRCLTPTPPSPNRNRVPCPAPAAESLETVLRELRPGTRGRLWVVFGSAGERDTEKRAAMGSVAAQLADVVVITDEDPRQEDRLVILEQIAAGATAAGGRRGD